MRRAPLALVLAAALAAPATAHADYRITGHGFGHGVGLAQYGAMGYALHTRHTYRWILAHYFPGTRRTTVAGLRMRVRLKEATALRAALASVARDAAGRRIALRATHVVRLVPWRADGLALEDRTAGRTLARLRAPVRLSGAVALRLLGQAENGVTDGRYHGALVFGRDGTLVRAVNDVALEDYLDGVVPAEMPAGWPAEALRAQAVAARSYAVTSRRPGAAFDVEADTRSQMYGGVNAESVSTTEAVRATAGVVLAYRGAIARTFFSSSSGGQTAAADAAFGGAPVPYLPSVPDPYDSLSPYHDWSVMLTDSDASQRLAPVLAGDLVDLQVVALTAGGRAATVRVIGTLGATDVPAATVRTLLALRSTWFAIEHVAPGAVPQP